MKNTLTCDTLMKRIPIFAVEKDYILSKYGDITIAFKVDLPEIFTSSAEDYQRLHDSWVKAVRVLPNYSILHKQDIFFTKEYMPSYEGEENPSFLTKAHERHFAEREYHEHICYLFISLSTKVNLSQTSMASTLIRGTLVAPEALNEEVLLRFNEAVAMFDSILCESKKIKLTRLREKEIIGDTFSPGLLDRYFSLNFDPATPKLIQKDIQLHPDTMKIGDQYVCVHSISDVDELPNEVSPAKASSGYSSPNSEIMLSYVAPLGILFPYNHILNQYIFIDDSNENLQKLESESKKMHSLQKLSRSNLHNYEEIEQHLNAAKQYALQSVRANCNVIAWADSEIELKRIKNDISAQLSMMDCNTGNSHKMTYNTINAPVFFWAACPGGGGFPSEESWYTFVDQACCFIANETNYVSSLSPISIKLVDRRGKPVHVDISDEPLRRGITANRNKFILGPSGSGKSFFTNLLVRNYYEKGTHVVLVDVGDSYKGLCQLINQQTGGKDGIYLTHTDENPITMNPFYTEDYNYHTEKKESIKSMILAIWKKDTEEISMAEEVALSEAVNRYILLIQENREIAPSFDTFYEYVMGDYRQVIALKKVKEQHFDIDNFIYVLSPYYQKGGGEFGYLLNSTQKIDLLNKRFVVFELDNIKDHKILFPIVTLIIMETFLNKIRRLKGVRKMILIEEAWKAIAKAGMAEFIKYLYKTVRKHFGEAIVVTQEIEDIVSSEIVKNTIINNSDCKILLDQAKYATRFKEIQDLLSLTEKQKSVILSINKNNNPKLAIYKEVYIGIAEEGKVYAVEVSKSEYLTYTTEATEKKELFDVASSLYANNLELAIKHLS